MLLVGVLVLKAAVPMLASLAASRQDVSMASVCSVYGVRTVALGDHDSAPAAAHGASDACALGALVAGPAPVDASAVALHAPGAARTERIAPPAPAPIDAHQRWLVARLHAPPLSA